MLKFREILFLVFLCIAEASLSEYKRQLQYNITDPTNDGEGDEVEAATLICGARLLLCQNSLLDLLETCELQDDPNFFRRRTQLLDNILADRAACLKRLNICEAAKEKFDCFTVNPAPTNPPTMAPAILLTTAPIKPPTAAPIIPPTAAPLIPPTAAPIIPPTAAPITPPTAAPITPPATVPITSPAAAPINPPTAVPIKLPTGMPLRPPTNAPNAVTGCIDTAEKLKMGFLTASTNKTSPTSLVLCSTTSSTSPIILSSVIDMTGKAFSLGCANIGTTKCLIKGTNNTRFFIGFPQAATFKSIHFTNGTAIFPSSSGGAFYISGGNVIFDTCKFTNNTASRGGAIFATGISTLVKIIGSSLLNNVGREVSISNENI